MNSATMRVLVLLLGLGAAAAVRGVITKDDQLTCNSRCTKPCKANPDEVLVCKTCKRGWARATQSSQDCSVCAKGYGTTIDPTLPLAVRRGFAACKKEPCGRCAACPQGTYSAGGAPSATPYAGATCGFQLPPPSIISAGYYWAQFARKQKLCPPDTFSGNDRSVEQAGIESCIPCSSLYAYRENTVTGELIISVATGVADRSSCECPAGTFWEVEYVGGGGGGDGGGDDGGHGGGDDGGHGGGGGGGGGDGKRLARRREGKNFACVACPSGSTSGAKGAISALACRKACQDGYYGDPSDPSYNYQCRQCPTAAGATAASSTGAWTTAPVQLQDCSTCVWPAFKSGSSEPAVCDTCPQGFLHNEANECKNCAIGYVPNGAACDKCDPTKWASNYESTGGPVKSVSCGGCQAGLYGSDCSINCTRGSHDGSGDDDNGNGHDDRSGGGDDGGGGGGDGGEGGGNNKADGRAWLLLPFPQTTIDNCVWGCPPGTGWAKEAKKCTPCVGNTYSPGGATGSPKPVCSTCPTGSTAIKAQGLDQPVPAGNTRCVLGVTAGAAADSVFDEFD